MEHENIKKGLKKRKARFEEEKILEWWSQFEWRAESVDENIHKVIEKINEEIRIETKLNLDSMYLYNLKTTLKRAKQILDYKQKNKREEAYSEVMQDLKIDIETGIKELQDFLL